MFPQNLIEPVAETSPAGEEGIYTLGFQQITTLAEYLVARLELSELERLLKVEYVGDNAESDLRVAESNAQDGRRKLERAEAAAKEVFGRTPSPEPVRKEVQERAERMLLDNGKDLRVVQQLALAWVLENGVDGLRDAFALIDALLERFGDELHPRPDEDDPTDLSAREMIVSELVNGDVLLAALRDSTVMESAGVGRFTGRDADVIDGRLHDSHDGGVRSAGEICAIAQSLAQGEQDATGVLHAVLARVEDCEAAARRVVQRFAAGSLHGDRVLQLLGRIAELLRAAQPSSEPAQESSAEAHPREEGWSPRAIAIQQGAHAQMGALRTREDARRLILQISRFLEETEPSHPAPFFLKRAERLLGAKDFFAIMRDMAPDALAEMERITGHRESESDS